MRRNCSSGEISPLFHNIFNILLAKGVRLHVHLWNLVVRLVFFSIKLHLHLWNLVVPLVFFSILQIWYVEVRISRSVSEGPFDFAITRVDCIFFDIRAVGIKRRYSYFLHHWQTSIHVSCLIHGQPFYIWSNTRYNLWRNELFDNVSNFNKINHNQAQLDVNII